jgi:hypothetical protein
MESIRKIFQILKKSNSWAGIFGFKPTFEGNQQGRILASKGKNLSGEKQ